MISLLEFLSEIRNGYFKHWENSLKIYSIELPLKWRNRYFNLFWSWKNILSQIKFEFLNKCSLLFHQFSLSMGFCAESIFIKFKKMKRKIFSRRNEKNHHTTDYFIFARRKFYEQKWLFKKCLRRKENPILIQGQK